MDKTSRNINNSVFSATSIVMLRNIALAYKSVTTWALSKGGRLTSIEILQCVLSEILFVFVNAFQWTVWAIPI